MYLQRVCVVICTIACIADIWMVECSKRRRTTRASKIERSTMGIQKLEIDEDNRTYHQTTKSPQYTWQYPLHHPTQTMPQYSSTQEPHYQPTSTPHYHSSTPPHYHSTSTPHYHSSTPPHYHTSTTPANRPTTPRPAIHQINVLDQFDQRYPDGAYEFRYELTDETVRYERGFMVSFQYKNILVVKGYYSYRLPDLKYLTVFYTADQNGYHQDSMTLSPNKPVLPRSLLVGSDLNKDSGVNKSIDIDE